jgi:hypothetical protein
MSNQERNNKIVTLSLMAGALAPLAALFYVVVTAPPADPLSPAQRAAQQQQALQAKLARDFNLARIAIPQDMYGLEKGAYRVTLDSANGRQDCTANVIYTHAGKQVVLTGCRPH